MSGTAIILLAAGASRRMGGRDKLLETVRGQPLLRDRAAACSAAGARAVLVVLPPESPARRAALDGLAVIPVTAPEAAEGMAASIRAGVAALPAGTTSVLLVLADMPDLTAADLAAVMAGFDPDDPAICRGAGPGGQPGHPVLFPARLFPALTRLRGDAGARAVAVTEPATLVPLPGDHASTDLDTPEDWARWRQRTRP